MTQFTSRLFGVLALLLIWSHASAQVSEFQNLHPIVLPEKTVKAYGNVTEAFEKRFPSTEKVTWQKSGKNFLAIFRKDDHTQHALFSPTARLIYTIFYGLEKDLPTDLRKSVKRMYVEFEISAAIKIEIGNRTIWVINLHDHEYIVSVRVEDGEFYELWKYAKAPPASATQAKH